MAENTLSRLYTEHTGKQYDKWSSYFPVYERTAGLYKHEQVNLLEIGVQNGGSLEIWAKFFSNAEHIIGCDIDERCGNLDFEDPRISLVIGDANTDKVENEINAISPKISIIIDDGSHKSGDVIKNFIRYFPHLEVNGVYIIEDLHTSYWADFEGGLNDPFSAISFFKRITDIINYEHWRNGKTRDSILNELLEHYNLNAKDLHLEMINRIEFVNSICIIYTSDPSKNSLGMRIVQGVDASVTGSQQQYNGASVFDQNVRIKEDDLDVINLIAEVKRLEENVNLQVNEINNLEQVIVRNDNQILELSEEISRLEEYAVSLKDEISRYVTSRSWSYTRPFRMLFRAVRRLIR